MAHRILVLAAAAVLASVAQSAARELAPKVPTALVEDVKSASAGVEFMDYVGSGQVIRLAAHDTLVLSYLQSCEQETITGGTVTVGAARSDVEGGQVVRSKSPCDGGNIRLSEAEASKSAASAFRVQSADTEITLYAQAPAVAFPKMLASADRTLVIRRVDRPGERHAIKLNDAKRPAKGFYDLANANLSLARAEFIRQASAAERSVPHRRQRQIRPGADREPPVAVRITASGICLSTHRLRRRAAAVGALIAICAALVAASPVFDGLRGWSIDILTLLRLAYLRPPACAGRLARSRGGA